MRRADRLPAGRRHDALLTRRRCAVRATSTPPATPPNGAPRQARAAWLAMAGAVCLAGLGLGLPGAARADAAGPRYTPLAPEAALLPRVPGQDAQPGVVFLGERGGVSYAANAAVARLVVEVDRDAVPADGQSAVRLQVRVYGRDGQPLRQPVYVTLEHSGGRLLLPTARTDEAGPRGLDADRAPRAGDARRRTAADLDPRLLRVLHERLLRVEASEA